MRVDKGVDRGVEGRVEGGDRGGGLDFTVSFSPPPTHQTSLPFLLLKYNKYPLHKLLN